MSTVAFVPADRSSALGTLAREALAEIVAVIDQVDPAAFEAALEALAQARRVAVYGVGREGLQLRGVAMRLYHLGLQVSMVGDMNCPPIGSADLLMVSAGPGWFSTVDALIGEAKAAGATVVLLTAREDGACARSADLCLTVPAQTMADDPQAPGSILPMGSLYEATLQILLELLVLRLRDRLGVSAAAMRERHTNLE